MGVVHMAIEVKGTLILDVIRIVRANKDKNWKKWLSPEDEEVVNGRIFPAAWVASMAVFNSFCMRRTYSYPVRECEDVGAYLEFL